MTSANWRSVFDLEKKKVRISELEKESSLIHFWDNPEEATKKSKELASLNEEVESVISFKKECVELGEMTTEFAGDEDMMTELFKRIIDLRKRVDKESFKIFLSGKFDRNNAIMEISSGAGGRDAEDFTAMLLRMYERYAEKRGYLVKGISSSFGEAGGPEGRSGLKNVSLRVSGHYAYGYLKGERGIHRLVRKSPFSSDDLRHTSFASVEIYPEMKEGSGEVEINDKDLRVDTFRSSGPGGQYVNKTESAVRVTHIPTGIVVSSQNERLQGENKRMAISMLRSKLEQMLEEEKKKKREEMKGETSSASWGNQIRNYVLHPYKIVKDLRTGIETTNVESVLDGDIDLFIEEEIKKLK